MLEKIEGIVLKTQDYGETHKIVTVFSNKAGKISAIARGAKKTKSRMAAVTQPFIHAQFLIYIKKGLSTIQQGEIISSFRSIREDIVKTAYAAYISELTDKLMETLSPDAFLYDQYYQTMKWIQENENDQAIIPIIMYELKMYEKGGFAPITEACSMCGGHLVPYTFSIKEGGLLCSACSKTDPYALAISERAARLLSIFKTTALEKVGNISIKKENEQFFRQLLDVYYEQYGGYLLKSKKFLNQLDQFQ
ncbi:DNA repair protein RecO [Virgibacillus sp. W0181]|uniref:DNA repair protein RecO n=1 Tax=Virgibacillus sp. W0181 TaxID=3391581 RepID=UPI003F44AC20